MRDETDYGRGEIRPNRRADSLKAEVRCKKLHLSVAVPLSTDQGQAPQLSGRPTHQLPKNFSGLIGHAKMYQAWLE